MGFTKEIRQISHKLPNPVKEFGYEPTTEYWGEIITLANSLMVRVAVSTANAKVLQKEADEIIREHIFTGDEHTAVEWAEIVMAINHMLWALYGLQEKYQIEELDIVLKALDALYYQWHDKAIKTLKGDDLSEYLRITD